MLREMRKRTKKEPHFGEARVRRMRGGVRRKN